MKKIAVCILLLVVLLCAVGCGEITYSVKIGESGSREYSYTVKLDPSDENVAAQRAALRTLFSYYAGLNERGEMVESESDPNTLIYRVTYSNLTDYYIANGITGNEPNEPREGEYVKPFFTEYTSLLNVAGKGDFAAYAMLYLNELDETFNQKYLEKTAQAVYSPQVSAPLRALLGNVLEEENAFDTLRRMNLENQTYTREYVDLSYNVMKLLGYDFATIDAYFSYSMIYKNVEGVDADSVTTEDGQTVYTWKLDPMGENTFTLKQTVPAVWAWELVAIAAGLAVALLGLAAVYLRIKKKNVNAEVCYVEGFAEEDSAHSGEEQPFTQSENTEESAVFTDLSPSFEETEQEPEKGEDSEKEPLNGEETKE